MPDMAFQQRRNAIPIPAANDNVATGNTAYNPIFLNNEAEMGARERASVARFLETNNVRAHANAPYAPIIIEDDEDKGSYDPIIIEDDEEMGSNYPIVIDDEEEMQSQQVRRDSQIPASNSNSPVLGNINAPPTSDNISETSTDDQHHCLLSSRGCLQVPPSAYGLNSQIRKATTNKKEPRYAWMDTLTDSSNSSTAVETAKGKGRARKPATTTKERRVRRRMQKNENQRKHRALDRGNGKQRRKDSTPAASAQASGENGEDDLAMALESAFDGDNRQRGMPSSSSDRVIDESTFANPEDEFRAAFDEEESEESTFPGTPDSLFGDSTDGLLVLDNPEDVAPGDRLYAGLPRST